MKDQLHRKLHFKSTPKRIVCLVPSLTELLVDLGLQKKMVGVTKFCVYPEGIRKSAAVIGGTKDVKVDKILDLTPDFILANKEENELKDVEALSEHCPIYVSDISTLDDLFQLILDLNAIFDIPVRSQQLAAHIQANYIKFRRKIKDQPKLKVAYFIWREPWMVAGSSTFINYMLELNNFENVYAQEARYPEVKLKNLKPVDYVLLSSEPFPFKEKHKEELGIHLDQVKLINGEYFSWYGSRLIKAFSYFQDLRASL